VPRVSVADADKRAEGRTPPVFIVRLQQPQRRPSPSSTGSPTHENGRNENGVPFSFLAVRRQQRPVEGEEGGQAKTGRVKALPERVSPGRGWRSPTPG